MIFWITYSLFVLAFSFLIGSFFKSDLRKLVFLFILFILLAPAQLEVGFSDYSPALITFIFNSILEQDYSLRVLRPLMLSIPISLLIWYAGLMIKKRFF